MHKSVFISKMPLRLYFIFFLCLFSSCSYFKKEDSGSEHAVARVFDKYLYRDDLSAAIPQGITGADSALIAEQYIEDWIRRKSVLQKAERNLPDEKKDVTRQLDEYRSSLISYAYESELVRQKLDTVVSDEEINKYYNDHLQNFELRDNIIKVIYLKLNKNSPNLEKARQWYKSDSRKDREALAEYCHQYAINYFLDDNTWLLFDDLLKEIPIKTYDKEQYLQNNRLIEIQDSGTVYLVNIKGFMVRNSISPLSFERKNIVTMIMNERKIRLIEEMERQVYDEGKKNGDIEIFRP